MFPVHSGYPFWCTLPYFSRVLLFSYVYTKHYEDNVHTDLRKEVYKQCNRPNEQVLISFAYDILKIHIHSKDENLLPT